jgi:DNA topoisomerase IA
LFARKRTLYPPKPHRTDTYYSERIAKIGRVNRNLEKKLRQIEKGEYDAKVFLDEMKEMVSRLLWR